MIPLLEVIVERVRELTMFGQYKAGDGYDKDIGLP